MTLILSGTDGLSDIDGSAATPAIRGTDTNTGIFFPAADTIAFSEGGTEAMRIDSSGRLGIGTTSPAQMLDVQSGSSPTVRIRNTAAAINNITQLLFEGTNTFSGTSTSFIQSISLNAGNSSTALVFGTNADGGGAASERARIDSSGRFLIGLTSSGGANRLLQVSGQIAAVSSTVFTELDSNAGSGAGFVGTQSNHPFAFKTNDTERARIDSSGNLLVGTTSQPISGVASRLAVSYATTDYVAGLRNTSATPYGLIINYSTAPNATGNEFILCSDSSATRMTVRSNGGIANYSANDANLSDRREKTNFAPAKDYLDTICAIPVQTFNYIDQSPDDPGLTLGVVAQDVQAVAPELVMESNWGTKEDPKMRLSVYQTDLQYALMKCIQEQQAIIQSLTARIEALEGK